MSPRVLGLVLCAWAAGCGGRSHSTPAEYPGHLRPPSEVAVSFMLRQHLRARYDGKESSFDAVLQKRGDELVLLGLAPYGGRAFVLTQRGEHYEAEKFVPVRLPFPPRHILNDIHRVFLRGTALGQRLPDGTHSFEEHGERVVERWEGGRLRVRTFERLDGTPAGTIDVDFQSEVPPGGIAPTEIVLRNGWFGYELHIATVEQRLL
jgi:hypothetical protein